MGHIRRCPRAVGSQLAIALLLAAGSAPALAQDTSAAPGDKSFDIQLFHPAVGPRSFITLDSAHVPEHRLFAVGFYSTLQYAPYVLFSEIAGEEKNEILAVRDQTTLELTGAIGLWNRVEIGFGLPFTPRLQGQDFTGEGAVLGSRFTAQGLGDLRVEAKVVVLRIGSIQRGLALAASLGGTAPTGDDGHYLGSGFPTGRARALVEWAASERFRMGAMAGMLARKTAYPYLSEVGHQALYGAAFEYRPESYVAFAGELAGRVGSLTYVDTNPIEAYGAIRMFLAKRLSMILGGGAGINHGVGSPRYRAFAGLAWTPDFRDRDGDGVIDVDDRCPDEVEDRDGFQDDDGCPEDDNDGDGIPDAQDKCPNEREDFDTVEDEDGCPDLDNDKDGVPDIKDPCPMEPEDGKGKRPDDGCPTSVEDTDGDRIPDRLDKCPEEPEDKDGFEDEDGCPDFDNDQDGIPDEYDQCPNAAEDMDGVKDEDGCPDLDNDQDGVPDAQDKCPTQPETLNGFKDDDGCPDKGSALVVLADDRIEVLEPIMCVESNGKQLLSLPSVMTLKLVAMVMKGHPEIARVRVEVRAAGSKEVAEARAQAVIEALRSQGVEPGRLKPVGLTGAEEGVDFFLERIAPQP